MLSAALKVVRTAVTQQSPIVHYINVCVCVFVSVHRQWQVNTERSVCSSDCVSGSGWRCGSRLRLWFEVWVSTLSTWVLKLISLSFSLSVHCLGQSRPHQGRHQRPVDQSVERFRTRPAVSSFLEGLLSRQPAYCLFKAKPASWHTYFCLIILFDELCQAPQFVCATRMCVQSSICVCVPVSVVWAWSFTST